MRRCIKTAVFLFIVVLMVCRYSVLIYHYQQYDESSVYSRELLQEKMSYMSSRSRERSYRNAMQINFPYTNYSTFVKIEAELLKFIRSNSLLVENGFKTHNCSGVMKDPYYRELMDDYLEAWHTFVPHQSKMDASNCWYVENFSDLPPHVVDAMKNVKNFLGFQDLYSKVNVNKIFKMLFSSGRRAVFSSKPTKHHFCLPKVSLVGFQKTGSTFLYQNIVSHPQLVEPQTKECHFWREIISTKDKSYHKLGVLLYLYHFFNASRSIQQHPDMFTIDGTVSTAFATSKPLREAEMDVCLVPLILSQTLPNMKILVSLRNPVERLWSGFLFFCSPSKWKAHQKLKTLEQTWMHVASVFHNYTVTALLEFRACIEGGHSLAHCTALAGSYPASTVSCERVRLGVGMYYVHLTKWVHIFPREQLHVTRLEDMSLDPSGVMDQVWNFLEVPPTAVAMEGKVWQNKWQRRKDGSEFDMFSETRTLLTKFYHPYNIKLAELLNDKRFLWTET